MVLLGLTGKKRSGKSTATDHLIQTYGFEEVSWAWPLKEIIGKELFGLTDAQLYGESADRERVIPEWDMSSRKILQVVGTDLFRQVWPDFWVKVGMRRIHKLISEDPERRIVVSDCRFPNEFDIIKELGGTTIRIVRKELASTDDHLSETALDDYEPDYTIVSGEGVDKLKRMVDLYMSHILKG
jgi:hypothetical protein